jgi:gamma-glutamylcyclotransferase
VNRMRRRVPYFAYGSNLCVERILARTPSATILARGWIDGYRLAFHKRSRDGSGKADAFHTAQKGDLVWGAVYALAARDKPVMDRFEGLGKDYEQRLVTVRTDAGYLVPAWVYTAHPATLDTTARPYAWYKNFVVTGAQQHGLPVRYQQHLAAVECLQDEDEKRNARERAVVSGRLVAKGRRILKSVSTGMQLYGHD